MKLEEIGFYTLCDERAKHSSAHTPMWRCELIITDACNFKCPYCRGIPNAVKGVMPTNRVIEITKMWADDGLKHIRYSGGEPTTHPGLLEIIRSAREFGIERIAISSNGSRSPELYRKLVDAGVNDFSISLDACCASGANEMSGTQAHFDTITSNIKMLSSLTYVTVGIVVTENNVEQTQEIVKFAHDLGVADIRIISAAQYNKILDNVKDIPEDILSAHPILKYRVNNIKNGRNVRGMSCSDCSKCHLINDDSVIVGNKHYPCVIYFREQGNPIGTVGPNMRQERIIWMNNHNSFDDPICNKNCLDVCIDYNNKAGLAKS